MSVVIKECLSWSKGQVNMVGMNDKVDEEWGITIHKITPKQIKELENGKAIYFTDGEYAHLIVYGLDVIE